MQPVSHPSPPSSPDPSLWTPSTRYRVIRLALVAAALVHLWQWGIWRPLNWPGVDYGKHWQAARAIMEGRSNYIGSYVGGDLWLGFNYPQATAFMFLWLGWLPLHASELVWKMMCFAFLLATLAMCWCCFRPRRAAPGPAHSQRAMLAREWPLVSLLVVTFYNPLISSIYIGNIDPVNAILVVGMLVALLRGRERLSGVLWALVTLIKMMPVILVLPCLVWRRWRMVRAFLAVMAVYFVILVVTGRLRYEWFFVDRVIPRIPHFWRGISVAPMRFIVGALGHDDWYDNPQTFHLLIKINLCVFGGAWLALIAWFRRRRVTLLTALECTLVFIPALSPLLEYHHFVWIMPVLLLQLRRLVERGFTTTVAVVLALGWGLLMASFEISFTLSSRTYWWHMPAAVSYLLILGGTLYDLLRNPELEAPEQSPGPQAT